MTARIAAFLLVLLLAARALAGSCAPGEQPGNAGLPADLLALMPTTIHGVLVSPSYDALEAEWERLRAVMPDVPGEDPMPPLQDAFRGDLPKLFDVLDTSRPGAIAFTIHPVMLQKSPTFVLILPMNRLLTDEEVGETFEADTWNRSGEYVAIATGPDYEPAPWSPSEAARLLSGQVAGFLDLKTLIDANRGMIEMGLGGLVLQMSLEQPGQDVPPLMTQEEAQSVADALRALFDSLGRLDLAWSGDDAELVLRSALAVIPGSPLDTVAQPPLVDALALARRLPADADLWWVTAWDQGPLQDVLRPLQRLNMQNSQAGMNEEQRQAALDWLESFYDMKALGTECMASVVDLDENGLSALTATRCDDTAQIVDHFTKLFSGETPAGDWLAVEALPDESIDGHRVSAWRMNFDALTAGMETDDPEEAATAARLFEMIPDQIRLCVIDDVAWIASDTDGSALHDLFAADGRLDRRAAKAAAAAGPDCQQVYGGDLRMIIEFIAGFLPELELPGTTEPARFSGHMNISGSELYSELRLDRSGLGALLQTLATLETPEKDED